MVTATPQAPLLALLNSQSPIRRDGHLYHGYTESRIRWRLHWSEGADGRCQIDQVRTELTVTITLPRLVGGDAALHRQFLTFLTALRRHELGHYAIAQEQARAVDERLRQIEAQRGCENLEARANQEGHRVLDIYYDKQRQYDAQTDHGRTQGVTIRE